MVLLELGGQIAAALKKLQSVNYINQEVLDNLIKEISNALMHADVNVAIVVKLRDRIKDRINQSNQKGTPTKRIVQSAVIQELINMVSSSKPPFIPKKGACSVILLVGLQGSGKTTTCTKYAFYYQKKGFSVALVCADTFRAGAFDQLKQNATRARIPFFGSYTEADPVKIAAQGVEKFKADHYDLIIVDTSGRHKQENDLFNEMKQVADAIRPNDIIFIVDSHVGQSCHDQAKAFSQAVDVGSVILTKMDGHARGGGALSAIAATNSPIQFIGTGEQMDEFEPFEPKSFISRLLGLGDIEGLFRTISNAVPIDTQPAMIERIAKGKLTLRDMYTQFKSMMSMGSLSTIMSMMPGIPTGTIPKEFEKERIGQLKKYMVAMDSMRPEELDSIVPINDSRLMRIARGSGISISDIKSLLDQQREFQKVASKLGKAGLNKDSAIQNMMKNPALLKQRLGQHLDPRILNTLGGSDGMMNMMKQFGQMPGGLDPTAILGNMPDNIQDMMKSMKNMFGRGKRR